MKNKELEQRGNDDYSVEGELNVDLAADAQSVCRKLADQTEIAPPSGRLLQDTKSHRNAVPRLQIQGRSRWQFG